jgi:hypothetical protein
MSLRAAVLTIATACTLFSSPLRAQPGMEPAELLIPFSAKEWGRWRVGGQAKRPGFTMVEYIPKGQVIANWDRMLTVQIFRNIPVKLADFMGKMSACMRSKNLPLTQAWV